MSNDLYILCIMQEKKTKQLPFLSTFTWEVKHRGKNSYPKDYYRKCDGYVGTWAFMNSCCGFLYYLLPADESLINYCGCGALCDVHYVEPAPTNRCLPDELAEYVSKRNTAVIIKPEYMRDFEKIIDYFLSESPVDMIIFLSRWQGEERDIVHGVIPRDEFFSMMTNKQIRLNMCYIISGHERKKWWQIRAEMFGLETTCTKD